MREMTMRLGLPLAMWIAAGVLMAACNPDGDGAAGTGSCGANTMAHWPDPAWTTPITQPKACTTNNSCNAVEDKPACAAASDNTCLCTKREGTKCVSSQCLWHVDPEILSCVCVPGSIQQCTTATSTPGIQTCETTGTSWGACT